MPTSTDVTPRQLADPGRTATLAWLAALCLLAFALHAALVLAGGWQWLDLALLQGIHRLQGAGADAFFLLVSALGHEWAVIPLDVLLVIGLACCRRWRASGFVLLVTAGSGALNVVFKTLFMRERPHLWPRLAEVHGWSFPSGHAMGSATLMLLLVIWAWPGRWRYPVLCPAVLLRCWWAAAGFTWGCTGPVMWWRAGCWPRPGYWALRRGCRVNGRGNCATEQIFPNRPSAACLPRLRRRVARV